MLWITTLVLAKFGQAQEGCSYGVKKQHKRSRHFLDESSRTALDDGFLLDKDESITEN
ncbi:hypothetical protein DPMN_194905 [Dreissena polymorpha]|uniref:Uncharacterized protein n=1 Tax=Dreissena polymorpha TaxID=45954 RepID=A0A9D4BE85_DREPO|nr:hypothetical protein DPMN_194905 [Dreissena polymorpha]